MADDPVQISEEEEKKIIETAIPYSDTNQNDNENGDDDEKETATTTKEESESLSPAKKKEKKIPFKTPANSLSHPNLESGPVIEQAFLTVDAEARDQVEQLESRESGSLITQVSISALSSVSVSASASASASVAVPVLGDDSSTVPHNDTVSDLNGDLDLVVDLDPQKTDSGDNLKVDLEKVTKKIRILQHNSDRTEEGKPHMSTANNNGKKTAKIVKKKPQVLKPRRRTLRSLTICFMNLKYEIVRTVAEQFGLVEVGEDEAWSSHVLWTDASITLDQVLNRQRFQLVNHFPGITDICRKDLLSRNLNRMKALFPNDYDIFPKTWNLPTDLGSLKIYAQSHKNETYICKPEFSSQGQGIFLLKSLRDLSSFGPRMICQLYIGRPFLIDNFKFDLRIYVLITSVEPLRVYLYRDGLARFATVKYHPPTPNNAQNSFMHLTNYSVNKYSRNYDPGENGNENDSAGSEEEEDCGCGRGSKRRFSTILHWLEKRGCNTTKLMQSIDDVIIKTIVSANPTLKHNYHVCFPHHTLSQSTSACFEILGFDIILDYKMKPYVLEVNHSPSFHTDTKLDEEVKSALLRDTFNMLNLRRRLDRQRAEADGRKRAQERLFHTKHIYGNIGQGQNPHGSRARGAESSWMSGGPSSEQLEQFQWEMEHPGGYRLIYPIQHCDAYDKFFEQGVSSFLHEVAPSSAASKKLHQNRFPYLKNQVSTAENESGAGFISGKINFNNILNDRLKKKSLAAVSRPSNISTNNNPWAAQPPKPRSKWPRLKPLGKDQETCNLVSAAISKLYNNKEKNKSRLHLVNFGQEEPRSESESGSGSSGLESQTEPEPQPIQTEESKLKRPKKKVTVKPPQNLPAKKLRIQTLNSNLGAKTNQRKRKKDPTAHFTASSLSFVPINIDVQEELDRLRGIMQRGILVENLGVELRVLNLLKQNGGLKSEDEEYFKGKYGSYEAAVFKSNENSETNSTTESESTRDTSNADDSNSNSTDDEGNCEENSQESLHAFKYP